MKVTEACISRPVGTSLLAAGLLLGGAIAFAFLPIAALPQVEYPTISVGASLPGADPATVATSVSAPLERRFAQIAGVNELTSSSVLGRSRINIQFDLGRSIDGAARDVEAAINAAASDLPNNLVAPPHYDKSNPADSPVIILALTSETMAPGEIYNYAVDIIAQRLRQIPGVGLVDVGGSEKSAVRVQMDPAYLAALGRSLEDVRAFIGKANANLPKGSLDCPEGSYVLRVNDQLMSAADYAPLVAFHHKNAGVRLADLGRVVDGVENVRSANWFGDRLATQIYVYKQTGANVIETVDRVRSLTPLIQSWMPPALHLQIVNDRTGTIRASVARIEGTILISILCVVGVVFLFLRRFWATFIPTCTVLMALAGTFIVMKLAGHTLDNLSLMALAVAVGFVVDDSIVVIENTFRHLEGGASPLAAARDGARQIGPTVLSMSLALVAVFIPLIFMTGLIGRLLHEFAITLTATILISGVISLTFTPMMCARFLRPDAVAASSSRALRAIADGFAALQRFYERRLRWVLGRQPLMLGVTGATMAATVILFFAIPKGFFPIEDTGQLQCVAEAAQDISFQAFAQKQTQLLSLIRTDPAVETISSAINNSSNSGWMFISLKPPAVRRADIFAVMARLRRLLSEVEGVTLFMQAVQELHVGGRSAKGSYQYTLQGSNWRELGRWANALVSALKALPHFQDVTTDLQPAGLEANIVFDREAAARLGVQVSAIDETLYDAFGQRHVSTIYGALSQHHVVLEATPRYQFDPSSLERIYVKSAQQRMVPLSAVARFSRSNTVLVVNHQGQFPCATVSFNLDRGYSLSDATDAIEDVAADLHLPGSIHGSFQGVARAFEDSLAAEPWLILAALVAVYLILGMLYESLIHPLTILSTLPSAGVGALLALMLTGHDLDLVGVIGIILLIGIVTKNAIMMIDFALATERAEGLPPRECIYRACVRRFRPILMTTMAALCGALSLSLRGGIGAELHRPLGISIVGGLLVSQVLTLFTTPVVYLALDRLRRKPKAAPAII